MDVDTCVLTFNEYKLAERFYAALRNIWCNMWCNIIMFMLVSILINQSMNESIGRSIHPSIIPSIDRPKCIYKVPLSRTTQLPVIVIIQFYFRQTFTVIKQNKTRNRQIKKEWVNVPHSTHTQSSKSLSSFVARHVTMFCKQIRQLHRWHRQVH